MTQKDLAEKSGVKRTVINNGIGYKNNPRVDHAYAVAKALGVTVEYLFTGIHPDGLAEDAQAILAAYGKLNADGRIAALAAVRGLEAAFPLSPAGVSSKTAT